MDKPRLSTLRAAVVIVLVSLVLGVTVITIFRNCKVRDLKIEGTGVVAKLEAHKRVHSKYPDSLGVAGIITRYPWAYNSSGEQCSLIAGDYSRDGFVLHWSSIDKKWNLDH